MSSSSYSETFSPRAHYSLSVETFPSASFDLNDYSPNATHLLAGNRDGLDSETLQLPYIQGPGHVKSQQTFATPFQRTYSNRSRKQNYRVPVQSHSDDQRRSDTVPGNEHPLVASPGEPAAALYGTHYSSSMILQHQANTASLQDIYHQLLGRIFELLMPSDLHQICSSVAQSAGFCDLPNFSGIDLFHLFEQQKLITPNNLDYLRDCLQAIGRMDLCSMIDDYMDTYLNRSSLSHGMPLAEPCPPSSYESRLPPHPPPSCEQHLLPCPPSSYAGPSHPPSYEEPRPPPFNPEYHDTMPTESHSNPVYPTPNMNTLHSGLNQSINHHPTQVEGDEHDDSQTFHATTGYHSQFQTDYHRTQVDVLMLQSVPSNNSEQLHEYIKKLHRQLADKNNEIGFLIQENHQFRLKLNSEKEKLFKAQQQINHCEHINECYVMQVDKMSALAQIKLCPLEERYLMNKRPHGIAVIINNSEFYPRSSADENCREGSDVDERNLCVTWKFLQYDVRIFRNLTASQITHELMQIAVQSHENYDSFVCCILSHGDLGVVFGIDNQAVKISDLANVFKGSSCESLYNKPKLFFIQACRGGDQDQGVIVQRDGGIRNSLPRDVDFLFSYATPPGNVSWRSPRYGTWYVSSLCQVFVDNAPQKDLLSMLTMVNSKVADAYTNEGFKQCPAPVNQLRKQVWFFGNSNNL